MLPRLVMCQAYYPSFFHTIQFLKFLMVGGGKKVVARYYKIGSAFDHCGTDCRELLIQGIGSKFFLDVICLGISVEEKVLWYLIMHF